MISKGHKAYFETLLRADKNGEVCVMECTDAKTGETVIAVCAVGRDANGDFQMTPLAKMFNGNPYEELLPPDVETLQ